MPAWKSMTPNGAMGVAATGQRGRASFAAHPKVRVTDHGKLLILLGHI